MTLYRIAVNACRLMIARIPKPRITCRIRRIYMIDALRNNRTASVKPQRAKLILGLCKKQFTITIPARRITTLSRRSAPHIRSFCAPQLLGGSGAGMRRTVSALVRQRAAARPSTNHFHTLCYCRHLRIILGGRRLSSTAYVSILGL